MFRSFEKNGKERKERSILLKRTEKNGKNVPFFRKERKRTERTEHSFEKNGCPTLPKHGQFSKFQHNFSLRPHLSLYSPFTATSRPLTATNFPRPKIFFYGHIWAKWPSPRPPGNPALIGLLHIPAWTLLHKFCLFNRKFW